MTKEQWDDLKPWLPPPPPESEKIDEALKKFMDIIAGRGPVGEWTFHVPGSFTVGRAQGGANGR